MNEIDRLVWPNPNGIGLPPTGSVKQTGTIAKTYGVIKNLPRGATNYTYAARAVAQLKARGIDVYGKNWKPETVTVTPGGK
jgi:NitT/TauT family transport system substrate-binding protein